MEALAIERTLTEVDHARLLSLVKRDLRADAASNDLSMLKELLDGCDVVAPRQVPADVATMHSQLLLSEPSSGRRLELTLCYPPDAEPASG